MHVSRLTTALAGSVLGCAISAAALAAPDRPATDAPAAANATATKPGAAPGNSGTGNSGTGGGSAAAANADPTVASVNKVPIRLSNVRAAAGQLPEEMRNLPPQMLFPMIVNQLIDQQALVDQARTEGLQNDPKVQDAMHHAADTVLQNALLAREVGPDITDAKLRAAYQTQYANKAGEPEVHARHILVASEAQAKDIIKQLDGGADFAALAKKMSTDKASATGSGGDLGWFKKGDMLPAFSAAAFSMKPGQISQTPIHTQYGWHVIQVLGTRVAPPPSFDSVKDQLRQTIVQNAVRSAVQAAVARVAVVRFNPDGSPAKPVAPSAAVPHGAGATALPAPAPPGPGTTPPTNE